MRKFDMSIVGVVGIPARYGGFETFVEHFVKCSTSLIKIQVFCSSKEYIRSERADNYHGVALNYIGVRANGFMSILYDMIGLFKSMYSSKVILVLGVSGGIFFPIVKLLSKSKLIVNIDGLEWRRAKWSIWARWYLKVSERVAVKFADRIIVDNAVLAVYVKEHYNKASHVIAYGGDHLQESLKSCGIVSKEFDFLSIARIEPENNIHVILDTFKKYATKSLTIIGNWNHSEYSRDLFSKYHRESNIFLVDSIYDNIKLAEYRIAAKAYIHGHSAGGSNPSLIESIFYDIPILAYDCDFNRSTLQETGSYWKNTEDLGRLLLDPQSSDSSDLKRYYTWEKVTQSYLGVISDYL